MPSELPAGLVPGAPDTAELLLYYLQREREHLLATLDGLTEHDVRRPMTPTATSLLGLVKHTATVEMGYLGECVGRPFPESLPWDTEAGMQAGEDMWATAEQSRADLVDLYRRIWAHSDASVRELGLAAPATVPWWPAERTSTTLGWLLVHLCDETAHHAGHADILRELIDGRGGRDQHELGDAQHWEDFRARVQAAADAY
jgi:uncharacterized damage-inducible protein DinB